MRIAVVGCGYWGSKHVRVLHAIPEITQVIAVDQSQERLLNLKHIFPGLEVHRSLDTALDRADALIVATPPRTHAALALAILGSGKSVLVEKPLATSVVDARRMIEAADSRSLVLMVGHTFEHDAAIWKLREIANSGELGEIRYIDSARLNLGLYQTDVNVIWDLAPHDVSIVNFILGPRRLRCRHGATATRTARSRTLRTSSSATPGTGRTRTST